MTLLPDHILEKMSDKDRRAIKQTTAKEAGEKHNLRLEREDQRQFSQWCNLNGIYHDWSRTDKRTTGRTGKPDFSVHHKGLTLFIEFKRPGQKLSEEQEAIQEWLTKQHFDYFVCYSDEEAIKGAKRFFAI
jgi:hypothetical protein